MSAVQSRPAQPSKVASAPLGAFASHKSALLERANPGVRRSTPDSEALASSDDETEHPRPFSSSANVSQPTKQVRRTSWLNEIPSASIRKPSTQLSSTYSPNDSLPETPSTELAGWPPAPGSPKMSSATGWGSATGSSFPWSSTGIWNENRKDRPARLQEVLSHSSATNPQGGTLLPTDLQSPLKTKTPLKDTAIPFSIPLHPTPKTYRSQSYSVGQLDPESLHLPSARSSGNAARGRGPGGGHQNVNLQHCPSRPSVLGELGHDSGTLGRVREVDDDDDEDEEEHENSSDGSQTHSAAHAKMIEQLTRENALLRQAANGQYENRMRERTGSSISATSGFSNPVVSSGNHRVRNNAFHGGDLAVEEHDDLGVHGEYGLSSGLGRINEQPSNYFEKQALSAVQVDNRSTESAKRAHWQTSLGFGGIAEMPQSRRHSFADVPTRQGSISSADRDEGYGTYGEDAQEPQGESSSYFPGPDRNRSGQAGSALHRSYVSPNAYGRPHYMDHHHTRPLFIVTFKCCRSDVFYIQEGTGLQVKPGDLVIVEADRGTDLGTVAHADISWEDARQLKDHYAEEHYKWLMLFSRQSQTGGPNAFNPNGLGANGTAGSAVGGMGPPGPHGPPDPQAGELKPKLIKRLAQNHEIQTLRDKEGNEAKAKRVCQQKVVEHRLNMEILDAEFQMDWKKLTFYYFADAYINFNSLVTDLFKIYKTRIWMSAINPASFVTPTSSLNVPPPTTAAALGVQGSRGSPAGRHPHPSHHLAHSSTGGYTDSPEQNRNSTAAPAAGHRNPYFAPYQGVNLGVNAQKGQDMTGFQRAMYHPLGSADPFSSHAGHHYAMLDPNAPTFSSSQRTPTRLDRGEKVPGQDWTGNLQGLTLSGM